MRPLLDAQCWYLHPLDHVQNGRQVIEQPTNLHDAGMSLLAAWWIQAGQTGSTSAVAGAQPQPQVQQPWCSDSVWRA